MKLLSPLRYPGGKAGLAPFLTDVLDLNDIRGVDYFEPYAGGAGAALALLADGIVRRISINDADFRIYSFWRTVLDEPTWFVDRIMTAKLDLQEWKELRETCLSPVGKDIRDVGFAAFYMKQGSQERVRVSGSALCRERSASISQRLRAQRSRGNLEIHRPAEDPAMGHVLRRRRARAAPVQESADCAVANQLLASGEASDE